ncbi:MAG: hypothetical protein ACXADB_00530 [Candidatus Hermodarchaeia archaeon]
MSDPHEIIVTIKDDPNQPRVVSFSDLFAIRDDITTMTHLWNTNCYYVNVLQKSFMINGGRRIRFNSPFGDCALLYRRRTRKTIALDGNGKPITEIAWIMGIEDKETKEMAFLIISEDGRNWEWRNKL